MSETEKPLGQILRETFNENLYEKRMKTKEERDYEKTMKKWKEWRPHLESLSKKGYGEHTFKMRCSNAIDILRKIVEKEEMEINVLEAVKGDDGNIIAKVQVKWR